MEVLYVTKMNDELPSAFLNKYFSDVEIQRILAKKIEHQRKLTFLGILMAKVLSSDYAPLGFKIVYPRLQKPVFNDRQGSSTPYHFSISHASNSVCCVLSIHNVGIDLEPLRPFKKSVMDLVFSPIEKEYVLQNILPMNKERLFFKIWTRKEALVKLLGQGLRYPLKELSFIQGDEIQSTLTLDKTTYYFYEDASKEKIMTVCSDAEVLPHIRRMTELSLYDLLKS